VHLVSWYRSLRGGVLPICDLSGNPNWSKNPSNTLAGMERGEGETLLETHLTADDKRLWLSCDFVHLFETDGIDFIVNI